MSITRRKISIYGSIILIATLSLTGFMIELSQFSEDSWTYFELSKSILDGKFYKFNTFRSYYSDIYSTSFPLGYPLIISAAQFIFGIGPLIAVAVNILAVGATWIVIIRLSKKLNLTILAGFAIAASLIFFTPYLNEVYSGRSIPVAILFFLLAIHLYLSNFSFLCGIFLGFCALVRFDYLVYSLVFQVATIILIKRPENKPLLLTLGFILGILPWILYSQIYFGKFWISDNSWVALSALPQIVTDFPAAPMISAIENPLLWIDRVLGNILPLIKWIIRSALKFPLIILLSLFLIYKIRDLTRAKHRKIFGLFVLICVSVTPYLLTGYFDIRYFSLIFLLTSGVIILLCESSEIKEGKIIKFKSLLITSIALSILTGGGFIAKLTLSGILHIGQIDMVKETIAHLNKCHSAHPEATYIFTSDPLSKYYDMKIAARYGATTGNRTAFIPTNFPTLNEEEKERYLNKMHPNFIVSIPIEIDKCPNTNE